MNEEYISLSIIFGWIILTVVVGYWYTRRKVKSSRVEEWFVAGRKLGLLVLWLSLGANIYSSYTFLGLPGLAAREGVSVWAITIYGMLSYLIGFWLIPRLWSSAKERGWLTLADAFRDLYNNRFIAGFVAVTGALWSIPYVQLQLQGMGYIIEVAGYGYIDPTMAKIIAFLLLVSFVVIGGLASIAGINALQGAIMLVTLWSIGLLAPIIAFGSYNRLFDILVGYEASKPLQSKFHLTPTINDLFFLYSIILVAPLAFWLWPNRIQNIFGARDPATVRKNMVLVGVYQLGQIPAILVGLTAVGLYATGVLGLPIYTKEVADKSFMLVTRLLFNPWIVGIVGSAALAASLSTAAAIIHVSGALFARNVLPSSGRLLFYARLFTAAIALISLYLALYKPDVLIYLLLVGYAGIAQFFPEYIIALKKPGLIGWRTAVIAMTAGMMTVGVVKGLYGRPYGIYEGLWGIFINLLIIAISILYKKLKR